MTVVFALLLLNEYDIRILLFNLFPSARAILSLRLGL